MTFFLISGGVYLLLSLGGSALGGRLEQAVSPERSTARRSARDELDVTAGAQA